MIIASLMSPAILVFWAEGVKANEKRVRTQERSVVSAPPEPFFFGKRSRPATFLDRVTGALGDLGKGAVELTGLKADDNNVSESNTVKVEDSEAIEKTEATANENTSTEAAATTLTQPAAIVDFDFDGDGKTDIGRWKPNTGEFEIVPSGGGSNLVYSLGSSSSKFVPADFDGLDGVDAAVFDSGTWSYKTSPGATAVTFSFGQAGDIPVPADFDGDGAADATVFRPSDGGWYTQASGYSGYFGTSGDIPVVGDYDGDGKADKAVFRPSTGDRHISGSLVGYYSINWGLSTDIPVPADYDNDGKTDPAVYRPSTGTWYYRLSNSSTYGTKVWGSYGDQPVPGDYNGDGIAELAVWRPSTGVWYIYDLDAETYSYETLGVPGDRAVASAYVKQIGGEVPTYQLAKDRLSPRNSTGGTDLYSQNFGWGTSLVGLSGRAGMNAGFGMSYNSLVWTKSGSEIYFDTNYDNISPGFRFGFPTLEAPYYFPGGISEDPYWAYVMVSPSGARTEFRQVAASEFFETADSSYLRLQTKNEPDPNEPVETIEITVRGTDGTVMSYVWIAGAFRCTQIKDRNGNFITIEHDEYGLLREVTDTLGREIVVNYDNELYPTTIQQTWKDSNGSGSNTTHTWATFSYTTETVATDFDSGLTVIGPPNSTVIKVLDKVTFPDGSYTKFHHNGYIQVYKIENFAPNNDLLNKVETDLESPGTVDDVPRFESTATTTANFNLDGSGNPQPVVVSLERTENESFSLPGSLSGDATLVETSMTGDPYSTVSRVYYGESGWKEGLVLATETVAANLVGDTPAIQRWTWNNWTQDNVSSSDVLNPRITETRVGDSVSTKRTTIEYCVETDPCPDAAIFGLPTKVKVYRSDLSTVIKESRMEYNLDSAYVNRRIIGLPSKTEAWGWNDGTSSLEYVSKVTFAYDEGDFSDSGLSQNISPVQHDNSKYGSGFITGRGNLTSTTRWDVEYPTTSASAVTSSSKYNTAGAVVSRTSPWDGTNTRTIKIGYADSWNSTGNPSTHAYPTTVTDPNDVSSNVKYRYDIGANVEANSPPPTGQTYGKTTKRVYDSKGRLERDSVYIGSTEHAYTRYEFPSNGIQSQVFSTLIDTNSNGPDAADEVLSESWFDGAGRVRFSRVPHTFSGGSTATWAGTVTEYDILGRVKRQSVPTEVNSSWVPAGDDTTYLWTVQKYDWMGRVVRKINTDGADSPTLNDSDILISYTGCGCAGGLETTIEGEEIIEKDWNDSPISSLGRKKQKIYSDILGRTWKSEVFNWNDTLYATSQTAFNGRDQAMTVTQTEASTSTSQVTAMLYDGHGRLTYRHEPIQAANRGTAYEYFPDGQVKKVTDARGASRNYSYNSLGLIEQITHDLPASVEGLTPWLYQIDKTSNVHLLIKGGNFGGNVEVLIGAYSQPNGWYVIESFSGGDLTRGTDGDHQTISFEVTEQQAIDMINDPETFQLQIVNTDTAQSSRRTSVYFYQTTTVMGYGSSDAPVAAPSVEFDYDNLGNATQITDGLGMIDYTYDPLSRITSETREFTEIENSEYTIDYTYEISGLLKTVTDPFERVVTYMHDKRGRLVAAAGTGYNFSDPLIEGTTYRAWGSVKEAEYGFGGTMNVAYDDRLRIAEFAVTGTTPANYTRGASYSYYADGQPRKVDDLSNSVFDKSYKYDQIGRLKEALSGFEARGETNPDPFPNRPYKHSYEYNGFSNRTGGEHQFWRTDMSSQVQWDYLNNRKTGPWAYSQVQYDADGRPAGNVLDANGKPVEHISKDLVGGYPSENPTQPAYEIRQKFDVGGQIGWREEIKRRDEQVGEVINVVTETTETFFVRSTVLGSQPLVEVKENGTQTGGYIYANGTLLAKQNNFCNQCQTGIEWVEQYPVTGTSNKVSSSGHAARQERDPMGANTGLEDPWANFEEPTFPDILGTQPMIEGGGNPLTPGGCVVDGVEWEDSFWCERGIESGAVVGAVYRHGRYIGQASFTSNGLGFFTAFWETSSTSPGWVPEYDDNDNVIGQTWHENAVNHTHLHSATFSLPSSKRITPRQTQISDHTFTTKRGLRVTVGQECLDALSTDGATTADLENAWNRMDEQPDNTFQLAAIGLHESKAGRFGNEVGGGKGRGWYQIDLGQHPKVTEAQANDFAFATGYANALINNAWQMVSNYERSDGYSYTGGQRLAMVYRIYNAGKVVPAMRKRLRETGDISVLDTGTNPPKQNYVTTLMGLNTHCFSNARF